MARSTLGAHVARALAVLALAAPTGCAGAEAPVAAPPAAPPRPAPPRAEPTLEGEVTPVFAPHHGLTIPLPDGARWQITETPRELVATHAPTGSTLRVRVSRPLAPTSRGACTEDLVARGVVPVLDDAALIERGPLAVPEGFDTELRAAILPAEPGAPLRGVVVAVGAAPRRCFAYVFSTTARSERALGARLATMTASSLRRVTSESGLAPRIPRESLPR